MKNSNSKKELLRKKRVREFVDSRIAVELYAIYKADTAIKNKPALPKNDRRRPAPPHNEHVSYLNYIKLLLVSFNTSIKASKNKPFDIGTSF